ncbi:hypothetical protein ASE68_13615 [Agromyces sp. Leaf222]|nr:hypothetical protein ASE68_13615 [Agromyces sp. Leaf222]
MAGGSLDVPASGVGDATVGAGDASTADGVGAASGIAEVQPASAIDSETRAMAASEPVRRREVGEWRIVGGIRSG